ncbi:hypothetical protein [Hymenobacter guriensis]|uniref:Uncharacterized protein n=1 Tax=Hymenobacter guriensis TaxID=2793065 RepID=A0ABS0KW49_9BACT|nr:hypothetical protein [Hymenobacter guriensis]MBG8552100.1 hypothetical protein [Hymenobacter guriensis]
MHSELQNAVEDLYRIFARYGLNPNMDGSPLYHDLSNWNRMLAAKPLRELTEDDLRIFYFKVMTTWGDVDDFRHFLPRIFELLTDLATGSGWEEWVALDKLCYGKWHTWPAAEQAAVQKYLWAFWQVLLTEDDEAKWIDALFEGYFAAIANVYPAFDQMLQLWAESDNQHAVRRLVDFVERNDRNVLKKRVLSEFDRSDEKGRVFFDWLLTDAILEKLTNAFFQYETQDFAANLSHVIQLLEAARATRG